MKLKSDLARRLERLEAKDEDHMPVFVWIDAEADADHLIAEAEEKHPGRPIMALSWMTSEGEREARGPSAPDPPPQHSIHRLLRQSPNQFPAEAYTQHSAKL
jgi:hypothetical protein